MSDTKPAPDYELDLRSTLEVMNDPAFVFDPGGQLLYLNRAAKQMFGFETVQAAMAASAGQIDVDRIVRRPGGAVIGAHDFVLRALAGEQVTEELEVISCVHSCAPVVLRVDVRPIIGRSGAIVGALKVGHDVTFEYELGRLKEQFVRDMSHELRTPATILRLAADRLLDGDSFSPTEVRKRAQTIDRATRRIESIALRLIDIAALSSGEALALEPRETNVGSLVSDVVATLDDAKGARVRLSTVPAAVRADAKRLRQVIEALLDNALRYSAAPAPVEVSVAAQDGVVEVSIADHGIGIPAAKQPHVFEQFYRAHSGTRFDRGGLGASLYLANCIVKAHGGRIWFESQEAGGSTFHVALTRHVPAEQETPSPAQSILS